MTKINLLNTWQENVSSDISRTFKITTSNIYFVSEMSPFLAEALKQDKLILCSKFSLTEEYIRSTFCVIKKDQKVL